MRKIAVLALLATCLSGCATAPSKLAGPACPSLPIYSPELQAKAADELDGLPPDSVIGNVFMPDYGRMRDAVRACLRAQSADDK